MPPDHREITVAANEERSSQSGPRRRNRSGTKPERLATPRSRPDGGRTRSASDSFDHQSDRFGNAPGLQSRNRVRNQVDSVTDVGTVDEPELTRGRYRAESPRVVAGIPAYNEGGTVASVVEDVTEYVDSVVVVDDGSEDETAARAASAGAKVIRHDQNRGYGAALRSIFEFAHRQEADCLVIVDADGQHDAADVPKLIGIQQSTDADVVIGSRFLGETGSTTPLYRRLGITVINVLTNASLGRLASAEYISDTQSGFRVYGPNAVETLADDIDIGDSMSASVDIIFQSDRHGLVIEEAPTTVDYDVENANSQNPLTHGFAVVANILVRARRERPLVLQGIPGVLGLLFGLALGTWTLADDRGLLTAVGLGLAVVSMILGALSVGSALSIHNQERPQ